MIDGYLSLEFVEVIVMDPCLRQRYGYLCVRRLRWSASLRNNDVTSDNLKFFRLFSLSRLISDSNNREREMPAW